MCVCVVIVFLFILIIADESHTELPPPPAPPAADGSLQLFVDVLSRRQTGSETREGSDWPALLKRGDDSSPQRGGLAKWLSQGKKKKKRKIQENKSEA